MGQNSSRKSWFLICSSTLYHAVPTYISYMARGTSLERPCGNCVLVCVLHLQSPAHCGEAGTSPPGDGWCHLQGKKGGGGWALRPDSSPDAELATLLTPVWRHHNLGCLTKGCNVWSGRGERREDVSGFLGLFSPFSGRDRLMTWGGRVGNASKHPQQQVWGVFWVGGWVGLEMK